MWGWEHWHLLLLFRLITVSYTHLLVLARSIQVFAGLKCAEKKAAVQTKKHSGSRARKRTEIKAEIKTEAETAAKTKTKAETKTEIKAEMKRKGPKENRNCLLYTSRCV